MLLPTIILDSLMNAMHNEYSFETNISIRWIVVEKFGPCIRCWYLNLGMLYLSLCITNNIMPFNTFYFSISNEIWHDSYPLRWHCCQNVCNCSISDVPWIDSQQMTHTTSINICEYVVNCSTKAVCAAAVFIFISRQR